MTNKSKARWYIKHGERIQGPFPNKLIGRFLILGRITQDALVSQDKVHWSPVKSYPAMVPEVVKEAGTAEGNRALMLAKIREDERSSENKDEDDYDNRREDEEQMVRLHRQMRDDVLKRYNARPKKNIVYYGIAVFLLLTLAGFFIVKYSGEPVRLADCSSPAMPGINWSGCNKQGENLRARNLSQVNFRSAKLELADLSAANLQGADLSYANLSQSVLVSAQLQSSNLKGANLRQANLRRANLTGADLSYAELVGSQLEGTVLKQAIFDHSIWVNGETCLAGSVGACLLPLEE